MTDPSARDPLTSLFQILAFATPSALLLLRLGQSPIVGYLLAGLVIGPGGLALLPEAAVVEFSEVGVSLLLFTIGMELSLGRLSELRRIALGGGALQVVGTGAAAALGLALLTGRPLEAVYVGCAVALSSSAIVLKTLADRGDLDAPHAGPATAIAIFQDLSTLPMLVVLPALAAGGAGGAGAGAVLADVGVAIAKAAALLGVLYFGSLYFVDRFLYFVARLRSQEVFILAATVLILVAAWGSRLVGLPLSLGAFVAGILLAESKYASQVLADVNPMKGIFQAIFFVSIGMLLEPAYVLAHPLPVLGAVAAVIVGKALAAALALWTVGVSARVATSTGIVLAQVGEFSFVVISIGRASGVLSDEVYQLTLAASFASMAVAPPLIANVRAIVDVLARTPRVGKGLAGGADASLAAHASGLKDHIVIGGFGPVGRDIATFLLDHGVEFVAIELNPKTVTDLQAAGISIFFGDFSNPTVLEEAGIERARAFIVAAPDIAAARRAVRIARDLNPQLMIVARTKYRTTVTPMLAAGANEVIEEEFETAIEMVARLTRVLGLSRATVADHIEGQRLERYVLQTPAPNAALDESQSMTAVKIAAAVAEHHAKAPPPNETGRETAP